MGRALRAGLCSRRERVRRLRVEPPAARWLKPPEEEAAPEEEPEKPAPLISQGVRSPGRPAKVERRDWLRQAAGF